MAKNWRNYYMLTESCTDFVSENIRGFVGVVSNDIRFCVDRNYQEKGCGTEMLLFTKKFFPNAIGKVKLDNVGSNKAFEKAKYVNFKTDEEFRYWKVE